MVNTPILYNRSAFDAKLGGNFKFSWNGDQVFKNRLRIYKNETNELVYDIVQTTFNLSHSVPLDLLSNGTLYNADLSVLNSKDMESTFSEKIIFICLAIPSFTFTNIIPNQVIKNSSLSVILSYSQTENESLQSFKIELHKTNHISVFSTGVKYDVSNLETTIPNLEDNTQYFIHATGETVNGMYVETDYIPFSVDYLLPSLYAVVSLENLRQEGSIKIESRMVQIIGRYEPDGSEPNYVEGDKIDLTTDGVKVIFDKGFSFSDNYSIGFRGCSFTVNKVISSWFSDKFKATLSTRKGIYESNENIEKAYIDLYVTCAAGNYYVMSNYFNIPPINKLITIWVRKNKNIFQIKVIDDNIDDIIE